MASDHEFERCRAILFVAYGPDGCRESDNFGDAMNELDLQVGRTYRAKKPACVGGFVNDRTITYIGTTVVQYDGPAVAMGRLRPTVSKEVFLRWASHNVTQELPVEEYMQWSAYLESKKVKP